MISAQPQTQHISLTILSYWDTWANYVWLSLNIDYTRSIPPNSLVYLHFAPPKRYQVNLHWTVHPPFSIRPMSTPHWLFPLLSHDKLSKTQQPKPRKKKRQSPGKCAESILGPPLGKAAGSHVAKLELRVEVSHLDPGWGTYCWDPCCGEPWVSLW